MNILGMLLDDSNSAVIGQIARQFNLDPNQAKDAIGQLAPALAKGMQNNIAQGGVEDLLNAIDKGQHQQYLDDPESLTADVGIQDGNNILGHLLGSKDASRQLASQAATNTGLDSGILKQMLPMVASMAMGAMSKNTASSGLMGLSGGAGQGGVATMLTQFLDADKDGSIVDDLVGMAGKFFK